MKKRLAYLPASMAPRAGHLVVECQPVKHQPWQLLDDNSGRGFQTEAEAIAAHPHAKWRMRRKDAA